MDLIEQAARRLEELRRAGFEAPEGPAESMPGGDPLSTKPSTVIEAAERLAGEEPVATPSVEPLPVAVAPLRTERARRRVSIDLSLLASRGYVTPDAPQSQTAQEFRLIKRPLIGNVQGKSGVRPQKANLVMVTSAVAGEGKSFCALNLALSMAMELDITVLLVDADVASPTLLGRLSLPDSRGLMDALVHKAIDVSELILDTSIDRLSLLPAGTQHERATELLASDAMTRLVDQLAAESPDRIVVFDSPPLLLTTEAPVLAAHMGQIVMIVEAERTSVNTLRLALNTVEKCPVVMTVLNKAPAFDVGSYHGYGYGHRQAR